MTVLILFASFLWMTISTGGFLAAMAALCFPGGAGWRDAVYAAGCLTAMGAAAVSVVYSLAAFVHAANGI